MSGDPALDAAFADGIALPWTATLSPAQAACLQQGWRARSMDEKWNVQYCAPYLYCCRSWTGQPVYRLRLDPTPAGVVIGEALWARAVALGPVVDPQREARALDTLLPSLLQGRGSRR